MKYLVFDNCGRILRSGQCQPHMLHYQARPGESAIEGEGRDDTHHVADGQVAPKLPCPAVLDGTTLRNLPLPSVLLIEGVSYPVDDGEAELTFNLPGTYTVRVKSVAYLDQEFTVST